VEDKTRLNIGDALTVYTEFYDGNDSGILVLNRKPIVELKELVFVGGTNFPISVGNVIIIPEEGILKARSDLTNGFEQRYFSRGKRNIKIVYTAGFIEVPQRLCHAILLLTSNFVLQHLANMTGGGDVSIQAFSRQFGARGKWGNVRTEYVAEATDIIRDFSTGVVN
jgi:hypothetical protein